MKKLITLTFLILALLTASGQTMDLTFTAIDNESYVQLDSIRVLNQTQGGDTVLYWPDTVLSIYYVGIPETPSGEDAFEVFQNYPNPVVDQTTISLYVPEQDRVSIIVNDILGRTSFQFDEVLDRGIQSFRFMPGNANIYFFTAQWKGHRSSIKILHLSSMNNEGSLEYVGSIQESPLLKSEKTIQEFPFNLGDELLYIGYTDTLGSGILDAPEESGDYAFQFATNIPCPGTPTVEYEGQIYNTIQIFSQCWLKENLNVGMMIPGHEAMGENDTIEKHCYNNSPDSCNKYGGLYEWREMLQYNDSDHMVIQGICPPGWHLPTIDEWKVLEGAVDSQYGIGDSEWDGCCLRGLDAGTNLKTTSGWNDSGHGTDLFGFSGMPGGRLTFGNVFEELGNFGSWWTSTNWQPEQAWNFSLHASYSESYIGFWSHWGESLSVRCIKD